MDKSHEEKIAALKKAGMIKDRPNLDDAMAEAIKHIKSRQSHVSLEYIVRDVMKCRVDANDIGVLAARLVRTKKYRREANPVNAPDETWIEKDPAYRNFWIDKVITGFVTAAFSLLVGYILWQINNREKNQQLRRLEKRLDMVENKLSSQSNK